MAHDRDVGGIRCMGVLAHLSDYLEGDLDPSIRGRVDAHLRGCDWCARFGGEMAAVVAGLRDELAAPAPVDAEVSARLRAALGLAGG